jgi:hypothetical protein
MTKPQARARRTDPKESHEAAESVKNVVIILKRIGDCTDEQIAHEYYRNVLYSGWELASDSGIRSRRAELVAMGKVERCGTGTTASGRPCAIWRAVK